MRKHRRSPNNGPTREKLPKHAFTVPRIFCETVAAKTCLIIALYCILSRHLLSEHPSQKRVFDRFLQRRPHRQIEGSIRITLEKAILNPEKGKHLKLSKPGKKYGSKIIEADEYVDNSPPPSELTTYPQPLLPGQREEVKGRRIAKTANAISTWVNHNQPPPDLCFANPPDGCVWITPRKDGMNWSKEVRVGKEPLTQSCHFAISVEEEIG